MFVARCSHECDKDATTPSYAARREMIGPRSSLLRFAVSAGHSANTVALSQK